ncbi:MAG: menaquinone biosynthesis protein [Planctomycetes bacterium]|nr:menaquinone biosynthesis protein [Planctomycetota bacterium]
MTRPVRIGAVRYLNSKPLIYRLEEFAPQAELRLDVPSRLADGLATGQLDVALIPSVEYFRCSRYRILPEMAIAAHGPVLSVKLYCRVPPPHIRTLALDEGSRTSVALVRILLERHFGLHPQTRPLPLGVPAEETDADAVLVIGDRAIRPLELGQVATLDLGEEWLKHTGLPFVFAMWVARGDADLNGVDRALVRAKQEGVRHVAEIAAREGPPLGLSVAECVQYLTEYIHFDFGPREIEGLQLFYREAARLGLVPEGVSLVFRDQPHLAEVR